MKVVITGSENVSDATLVEKVIKESPFDIDKILSKAQNAVDGLAEDYAQKNGIPCQTFRTLWSRHGKRECAMLADEMAKFVDGIILICDEYSPLNKSFLRVADERKIPIFVYDCKKSVAVISNFGTE
jgi:hypothetical protein